MMRSSQYFGRFQTMKRTLICLEITALLLCINGITTVKAIWQLSANEAPGTQKFKIKTELAEVRVVVTDRQNKIIENLRKEDFELLDNNRPQEISIFSCEGVRDEPGRPAASDGVAQNNAGETQSAREQLRETPSRSTLFYIDNLHLSFSNLNRSKQVISRYLDERMTKRDMIAIVSGRGALGIAQQFTQDRQLLRYGIEQISLGPIKRSSYFTPTVASDVLADWAAAMFLAINILRSEDGIDGDYSMMKDLARSRAREIVTEAVYLRRATLLALREQVEKMMGLPGQRIVVVFSEGFSLREDLGGPDMAEVQAIIDRAVRLGVLIYSIDANGLQTLKTNDVSIPVPYDSVSGPLLQWYASKARDEELHAMFALANDTGGKVLQNHNDLNDALGEALDSNRFNYVLGYYLPSDSDMRKPRNIRIRLRNHPEYTVKARKTFFSSDSIKARENEEEKTPRQRLLQAVNAPLPQTDLGVSALADFMEVANDNKQVSLRVYLEGNKLQYKAQNLNHALGLEILYTIFDSAGKQMDAHTANVDVTLTPERLIQAQTNGYIFSQRLSLKPGAYQVRVGIREKDSDHIGTATAWIEVQELTRGKLEISSLILGDPLPGKSAAAEGININNMSHEKMIYGTHLYSRDDACGYFFRIFHSMQDSANSSLALKKEFYQGGRLIKQGDWVSIPEDEMHPDSKGWADISGKADIATLNPGIYEMRISVKDNKSKTSVQRSAIFGIK
jgi:VWFA-related protein